MLILPAKSRLKWGLFAGCVAFHLGIVATMMIPYANLACIAAGPIIFRHEIMSWLGVSTHNRFPHVPAQICWRTRSALAFVAVLMMAMVAETRIPSWRFASREHPLEGDGRVGFMKTEHNIFYTPLWLIGIAQSYRLFDWIDDRNFHTRYEITEQQGASTRRVEPVELFPVTLRSVLLQGYLHDVTWGRVPQNRADEFKAGLAARFASRYCRTHPTTGRIEVHSQLERIKVHGTLVREDVELLMKFECQHSEASLQFPRAAVRAVAVAR
jgi:hypothetical protein